MKIITFAAIKGGVGKTTLAFNYGSYLAAHDRKVLFFDLDHQSNLTQIYQIYDNHDTVASIFQAQPHGEQTPLSIIRHVADNIDIVPGDMNLDSCETQLATKSCQNNRLFNWLANNFDAIDRQYDDVIIDTHPDFGIATKNAIMASDVIISPLTPSEHGYNAKFNLSLRLDDFKQSMYDYRHQEDTITAKLLFVGNRIKHNTTSSRQFAAKMADNDNVVALIPEKELFNKSTINKQSLSQMATDHQLYQQQRAFFDDINRVWGAIDTAVNAAN